MTNKQPQQPQESACKTGNADAEIGLEVEFQEDAENRWHQIFKLLDKLIGRSPDGDGSPA